MVERLEAHLFEGRDQPGRVRFDVLAPSLWFEDHAALRADVAAGG